MADRPRAVIVFNRVEPGAAPDEADVLVQAEVVRQALEKTGYRCELMAADLDLENLRRTLRRDRPSVVFNLVESLGGSDRLAPLVPAVLEHEGYPFTGAPATAMYLTTHKPVAKAWLRAHGIPTPDWWLAGEPAPADVPCIVKSVCEQASLGLDDDCVVTGAAAVDQRIASCRARWGGEWFAEAFIDGREVNVSLLAGRDGPTVLPLAEICFRDFPPGKARLVGYRAKWDESSFECRNTPRQFLVEASERALCARLREISARCWEIFGLRGYARVDFRIDAASRPWVLEVNSNPCLSPDAGFAAALAQAGIAFADGVGRIVAAALRPGTNAT